MHSRNIREGMVRYSLGVKFLGTLWWVDNHVTYNFPFVVNDLNHCTESKTTD